MSQLSDLPQDATAAYKRLTERLVIARKIRGWSAQDTALRCGINRNTLRTLEQGKMVNTAVLLKVLGQYNMIAELDLLAQPDNDQLGHTLAGNRNPTADLDNNF